MAEKPVEAPLEKEVVTELAFPRFSAKFSTYNGALVSWQLVDPRFQHDATKGELLPNPAVFKSNGAFKLGFSRDSTFHIPALTEWKGEKLSDTEMRFTWPAKPSPSDVIGIEKVYTIDPNSYIVRMTAKIAFHVPAGKEAYQTLILTAHEFQDPKNAENGKSSQAMARAWHSASMREGAVVTTPVTEMIKSQAIDGLARHEKNIQWTGFEHPYLLVAFAPKPDNVGMVFEKRTIVDENGFMTTDISFPRETITDSKVVTRSVVGYLGPKNYKDLERADDVAGFETGFKTTIDLGWFAFIGRPLMWLLLKFQSVVGNWGIAIILLTFLVKGLTLYWTTKSMRSMKAMAALGPQMKTLQAKYKEDKPRLQAETMALYKQHNVNPIAGCLPILLQMPIWLALYRMLSSAGELYQQPFIPGWINDLTAPDPTHVLPAVLVITMFVQARLTPATGDSTQQKIMQYGMPLMFGVMSFFFPAGLTLYIFTNTLLSALHSIYMNRYDKKSLAIAAMVKANAAKIDADKAAEAAKVAKVKGAADVKEAKAKAKSSSNGAKTKSTDSSSEADAGELAGSGDDNESDESDAEDPASASGAQAGRPRQRRKKRRR